MTPTPPVQPPQGGQGQNDPTNVQPQSQGSPWDADLAFIEDEATRNQVSNYLGQKVQPYVTQLETRAKPALDLYQEYEQDPGATTLGMIEEVYGPDSAKAFAEFVAGYDPGTDPGPESQPNTEPSSSDPRIAKMLESWEATEQEKEWASALTDLQQAEKETAEREQREAVEIDDLLFRPFAAMTNGDLDQALVGYKNFLATAQEKLAPPANGAPAAQAPPALGSAGGATEPPIQPTGQTLDEAIVDWAKDLNAQGQSVIPPNPAS
jgi:hypothetical protein